jgi:hypothetical protein
MNLRRWLSIILMLGVILALSSLSAQADPYRPYRWHPRGHAYGWDGPRHHRFDRYERRFGHRWRGPHHPYFAKRCYGGAPPVAYVTPVAPVVGVPYAAPQPYYSQPGPRGLSGSIQYNF